MLEQSKKAIETHIKTHSQRSAEDYAAVGTLEYFLGSGGRIITDFPKGDKWPNIDGKFEFVEEPNISRRPAQNFFAQIKGTHDYSEKDGMVKYSLKSLAFPAFIANDVTLDPGILFVVINPDIIPVIINSTKSSSQTSQLKIYQTLYLKFLSFLLL